jgi:hypothetical protein
MNKYEKRRLDFGAPGSAKFIREQLKSDEVPFWAIKMAFFGLGLQECYRRLYLEDDQDLDIEHALLWEIALDGKDHARYEEAKQSRYRINKDDFLPIEE